MTFYEFGRNVAYHFLRLIFGIRYEGLEHIPEKGGYILACNHRSFCDPVVIASLLPQKVHYLAKAELIKVPVVGGIIRALGIIPVHRGAGDSSALDAAVEVLKDGGVVGIFPEGTRSRDGKPLRPRSGISVIAGKTGADILPCAVSYPRGIRFRAPVVVRYGPLIKGETLGIEPAVPSTLKVGTRAIMGAIISLMEPIGEDAP